MLRQVLIVGEKQAIKSRREIMLAQGFKVSTLNYSQAKKIGILTLENKINVIDFKHLTPLIIKKINRINYKRNY